MKRIGGRVCDSIMLGTWHGTWYDWESCADAIIENSSSEDGRQQAARQLARVAYPPGRTYGGMICRV